jgi:hypothetical protein
MVADSVAASTVRDLGLELPARRGAANYAGGSPRRNAPTALLISPWRGPTSSIDRKNRRGLEDIVGHLGVLDGSGAPVVHGPKTHPSAPGLHFIGMLPTLKGLLFQITEMHSRSAQPRESPFGADRLASSQVEGGPGRDPERVSSIWRKGGCPNRRVQPSFHRIRSGESRCLGWHAPVESGSR